MIINPRRLGLIYFLIGIVLLTTYFAWKINRSRILSFKAPDSSSFETVVQKVGAKPNHIKIPKFGVDMDVAEAQIVEGVWQVFPEKASHLGVSSGIDGGGNIVIYGHNKVNALGPIRWTSPGDIIELTGEDGVIYTYRIEKTIEVEPDNLEYVLPKSEEVLTVYTCSGFLDSKRFVVVAKKIQSEVY